MPGVSIASCSGEFIGTFILVLTVGCNVLAGNPVWGGLSIASSLMVSVYALGKASGAHFNPAVSLALGLAGKLDEGVRQFGIYFLIQVAAGLCAAFTYCNIYGDNFNLGPTTGFRWWQAMLCEMTYTFMLCFVVLNTAASKQLGGKNQFYGLAIGFVIAAGAYGPGAVSGACFNPAVAIAIDATSLGKGFGWCILYALFEFLGAVLSVGAFWVMRPEERQQTMPPEEYTGRSKLVGEAIGTFIVVVTASLNVLTASKASAFSIAACEMCMIYAIGDVSGGHFNPALTLAAKVSGQGNMGESAGAYVLVQLTSGLLGALVSSLAMGGSTYALGPAAGFGWISVSAAESLYTFLLCFVMLCVGMGKERPAPELSGLVVGMTVTVGGLAIGNISGGSLNPAVSLGVAAARVLYGGTFYKGIIYTVVEVGGSIAAVAVYRIIYPEKNHVQKAPLSK